MTKNTTETTQLKQLDLARFLPYRLSILSNKVSGIIAQTYKDKFALSITEWRIMAVLGEHSGISADEISVKTQIEKSILSRAISKLLNRHLIIRTVAQDDRRRSEIRLSETGQTVYQEIVPLSYAYEEKLLGCLSMQERQQFSELIDRLAGHAESLQP